MKRPPSSLATTARTFLIVATLGMAPAAQAQSGAFVHRATAENRIALNQMQIDNDLLGGAQLLPDALPLVTPIWNPDLGPSGIYFDGEFDVHFINSSGWFVSASSEEEIPLGAAFNVWVPRPAGLPAPGAAFLHVATTGNSAGNVTELDHPLLNGHPEAILTVTKSLSTQYHPNLAPIGVAYNPARARWTIYREDEVNIIQTDGDWPRYHVGVGASGLAFDPSLVVQASGICTVTTSNHCLLGLTDSRANLQFQRVYGGAYRPEVLGIWWTAAEWSVFRQDQLEMDPGIAWRATLTRAIFESGFETGDIQGWTFPP